jgi:hypothetical protein
VAGRGPWRPIRRALLASSIARRDQVGRPVPPRRASNQEGTGCLRPRALTGPCISVLFPARCAGEPQRGKATSNGPGCANRTSHSGRMQGGCDIRQSMRAFRGTASTTWFLFLIALGCCLSTIRASPSPRSAPLTLHFSDSILAYGLKGLRDETADSQHPPQGNEPTTTSPAASDRVVRPGMSVLRGGGAVVPTVASYNEVPTMKGWQQRALGVKGSGAVVTVLKISPPCELISRLLTCTQLQVLPHSPLC